MNLLNLCIIIFQLLELIKGSSAWGGSARKMFRLRYFSSDFEPDFAHFFWICGGFGTSQKWIRNLNFDQKRPLVWPKKTVIFGPKRLLFCPEKAGFGQQKLTWFLAWLILIVAPQRSRILISSIFNIYTSPNSKVLWHYILQLLKKSTCSCLLLLN